MHRLLAVWSTAALCVSGGVAHHVRRVQRPAPLVSPRSARQVRNERNEIYVHQRAPSKSVHPSMYDMFVGGLVVAGETPETAARCEPTASLAEKKPQRSLAVSAVLPTTASDGTHQMPAVTTPPFADASGSESRALRLVLRRGVSRRVRVVPRRNEVKEELGVDVAHAGASMQYMFDHDFIGPRNRVVVSCYCVTVQVHPSPSPDQREAKTRLPG